MIFVAVLLLSNSQTSSVKAEETGEETFHDWDSYETSYVYNQLPSNMKQYWDYLDSYFDELLTTTADYHDTVYVDRSASYGGVYPQYLVEKITIPSYMTEEDMEKLFYVYDKSKYYFVIDLHEKIFPDADGNIVKEFYIYFYPEFQDGDTRMTYTKKYNAKLNQIRAAALTNGRNDYEKMKYVYDYICIVADYNYDLLSYCDAGYMPGNFGRSAAGLFEEQKIVCQSYADAYALIMNSMGYDVVVVTNRSHAWNRIKLDGVWYIADATFEDNDDFEEDATHWYFLKPESKHFGVKDEASVASYFPAADSHAYKVNNCDHEFENIDSFPGSCTKERWSLDVCKDCGYREKSFWRALGHDYQVTEEVETTEEVVGYKVYTCSRCEDSYKEYDPSHEHAYSLIESVTADCYNCGYDKYTCDVCGNIKFENQVDDLGHDYQTYEYVPSSCVSNGSVNEKCTRCGDITPTRILEKYPHSYYFYKKVAPGCTTDGYDIYTCACGLEEHRNVVAASHKESFVKTVAPTCQAEGYDLYKCTVCKEEIHKNERDKLPHDYEAQNTVEPTCTADGYTVYKCKDCSATKNDDIVAAHHDFSFVKTVAPTCQAKGYDLYKCDNCTATEHRNEVDALGHDFVYNSKVDYTCTTDGYDIYNCSRCSESEHRNVVDAHHDINFVKTVAPTCQAKGYDLYKCDNCVETEHRNKTEKVAHNYEAQSTVEPTCTAEGYTVYKCKYCTATKNDDTVAALVHDLKTTVTKATPTKCGSTVVTCNHSGCTYKSTNTIYYPKTFKLSASSYTYDGKVKTPTIKIYGSDGKLISSSNYTVAYSSEGKNVGIYTVNITFNGSYYTGTKSLSFKINPKDTSISKLSAVKAGFKVTLKKQSTQTTGYQVQYSTSSKFTNATTKSIKKNSTIAAKYTKLSIDKKYYVRVRTYKVVDGIYYYSAWSSAKSVTTKK